jgi:DNA helicase-2/ATP-dependent DNA helicase PcrA
VRALAAASDIDEAAFIVDVTKSLAADGLALSEVAVLYRSNAQSRLIEHALFNAAIPYRVYGGMRFFERAEVKSALAYLRLLAVPTTTARSCASSTFRRGGSARARSST